MPGSRSPLPIWPPRGTQKGCSGRPQEALIALLAAVGVLLALAFASGPAAAATGLPALQAELSRELALGGAGSSADVYDLSAQQTLFSQRASVERPPASVEKLYTAAAALEQLGPGARLSTTVLGSGSLAAPGLWQGSLYLRGGGDPTFGSSAFIRRRYDGLGASVSTLAARLLRALGIREVTGAIYGDESYFNSLRGGPASGYAFDSFLEGSLSGLAFDRGASRGERGAHAPAVYAARQLSRALRRAGVRIHGAVGAAVAPPGAQTLAVVRSPTVAQLLGLMLPPSDNFFAETLIKDLGARFGGAGSTAAGAAVVRETISAVFGINAAITDGSGLSRSDRTSAQHVVSLLAALAPTPLGVVLRGALAVAGRTGTLVHRMRGTAAAGRCQAKTGTLIGASSLAGYCQSSEGHLLAFASFNDGIATGFAHELQDRLAIALAGY